MTRFEIFNEMLFESYCKKSVGNAIKKEREKKSAKGKLELSFSALTGAMLYALSTQNDGTGQPEEPYQVFNLESRPMILCHNIPVWQECAVSSRTHPCGPGMACVTTTE